MQAQARVAVIGGGVVGCSVLYHLTKRGWRDVVLLERSELTAGSTWHAAGGMHTLNGDANVAALQKYTIQLYREIEQASGIPCGIHQPGCVYLAANDREHDFFRVERAKARYLGIALDFIPLEEVARLNPLVDVSKFTAAMLDPNDGYVDPSSVTNAYAKAARQAGATVYRHTPVTSLRRRPSGEWEVGTPQGTLIAEYVVNAGGLWAREVGALAGIELPIVPLEHQYIVTNDIPALKELGREVAMVVDFDGASYVRQEGMGLLLGTYEQDCRHWAKDGTPADFGIELLPEDLGRIESALDVATQRIPVLAEAGIKRVVNGGMVFSPDGNPIIGPVPGVPGYFLAAGCMAGFSQGGGVGLAVSNWIVDGEPGMDVFAMDVTRFGGGYATRDYVLSKTTENYQRRFIIPCPNEELPAARPSRVTPIYDELRAAGAVFGAAAGWEVPLWFAGSAEHAVETPSFRRSNAFEPVGEECRAVRTAVGLWETSCYCKIEISGEGAAAWLDGIVANRVPEEGRIALAPMLTEAGRILGDVTLLRLAADRFLMMGSPVAESHYLRWLGQCPAGAQVRVRSASSDLTGLAITGPRARELLARITGQDVSSSTLPFLSVRRIRIGAADAWVARISFTGELGYEIYTAPDRQRGVYESLRDAGSSLGLRLFGVRALNSLRLEKGYGGWGRELTSDYTPDEAGLARFVRLEKRGFIGRDAVVASRSKPVARSSRLLAIDTGNVDPFGNEAVFAGNQAVARLTSAGHSYTFGYGLGLAYLTPEAAKAGRLEIELLGERYPARVLEKPPHDPEGGRLRS